MDSSDARHETAVRYLLGELTEEECDALEQSYFAREDGFEELLAIEQELIDAYVAGDLPTERRARFESRLPASQHRDAIDFARALRATLDAPKRRRRPGPWLAAAAVLALAAAAWVALRSGRGPEERTAGQSAPTAAPLAAPSVSETPRAAAPQALAVTLAPGLLRDAGRMTRIVVPPATERLVFTLVLEGETAATYQAELQKASGAPVDHFAPLRPHKGDGGTVVDVFVLARPLLAGDYVLQLQSGPGGRVAEAEYVFRIVRPEQDP
jgi:hypothetical protein